MLKEKFEGNAYTDFGSKVGEALENDDFSEFTEKEQEFLKSVERYDEFERKINLQMDGFKVVGFVDSNTLETKKKNGKKVEVVKHLIDYKTGSVETKVSEYESDKYTQLHIYAAALEQELGVLPETAKVVLIDRVGNAFKGEELKLGDTCVEIEKNISKEVIDKVLKDVQDTAEEISKYYEIFLKLNKL
jgi:hypothetical protein